MKSKEQQSYTNMSKMRKNEKTPQELSLDLCIKNLNTFKRIIAKFK